MKFFAVLCAVATYLYIYTYIYATDVRINEFLIESSPQKVELINTASESADISNWYIDDAGGLTYFTVPQGTILYPNSCQVFSSDFNLNKSSQDTVRLFDNASPPTSSSARLVDSYEYKASPGIGKSFLRLPDASANWIATEESIGLFNLSREPCAITPTPTPPPAGGPTPLSGAPTATIQPEPTPTPAPKPISYQNIFLSEVMVNPETGSNEWVELFNNNDFDVELSHWYLDDGENEGATPKKFSLNISAKNYGVIDLTSSLFNNDDDQVRILDFDKIRKDSFEYGKNGKGNTFGRVSFDSDEFCEQNPSKGESNSGCIGPESSPTPTQKLSQTKKKILIPLTNVSPSVFRYKNVQAASPQETPIKEVVLSEVLGASDTEVPLSNNFPLLRSLSFSSFSFSLLTMVSLFLRMRT